MKHLILLAAFASIFLGATDLWAQKATEIFIPIGKSPGLSGKYTMIGTIDSLGAQGQTVRIKTDETSYPVRCNDETKIWLDRTLLRKTNQVGDVSDLKIGLKAEVKFIDNDREKMVEWIKVQISPEVENP